MPESIIKNLGKAIKDARKSHNLTQDNLSELTGISKRHIANIENGKANASIEIIIILVKELRISLDNIIFENELTINDKLLKEISIKLDEYSLNDKLFIIDFIDLFLAKMDYYIYLKNK